VRQGYKVKHNLLEVVFIAGITFNEDKNITRTGHAVENFAVVRRIALNITKNYDIYHIAKNGRQTAEKFSVKSKLKKCEYDHDFLLDLLLSSVNLNPQLIFHA
jgi:hypothetical protein